MSKIVGASNLHLFEQYSRLIKSRFQELTLKGMSLINFCGAWEYDLSEWHTLQIAHSLNISQSLLSSWVLMNILQTNCKWRGKPQTKICISNYLIIFYFPTSAIPTFLGNSSPILQQFLGNPAMAS